MLHEGTGQNGYAEMAPIVAAALSYATRGWHVFPQRPDGGSYRSAADSDGSPWGATTDAAEIIKNFQRWPTAYIGVVCGSISGLIVIDVDKAGGHAHDGAPNLQALEERYGPLPPTLEAGTPSGGNHKLYKHPGPHVHITSTNSKIALGVDIKADGSCFTAAPSVKPNGAYVWLNDLEIAELPAWAL